MLVYKTLPGVSNRQLLFNQYQSLYHVLFHL